jgi:hypothetical protein
MIEGITFQLGKMSGIDISKTFAGQQYKSIVNRMKKAYVAGFLKADKSYFAFDTRDRFTDLILYHSYKDNATALLLNNVNWVNLKKKSIKQPGLLVEVNDKQKEIKRYDSYIFVPSSPMEVLRINK